MLGVLLEVLDMLESRRRNSDRREEAVRQNEEWLMMVRIMEQCHSGGYNDAVIESSTAERTTFAAACTEGKNSRGGADFDPFTRDWIAAFAGADPYGAALVSDPDYG